MNLDLKNLPQTINTKLQPIKPFFGLLFGLIVVVMCGYLLFQVSQASSAPAASDTAVTVRKSPRIDESLVKRLESLEDNSVSVKSLFNDARTNPFD